MKNKRMGRYVRYAIGETILVVVGILIALQIDNWNNDRQESATLDSYLNSVARNVQSDVIELGELREKRRESLLNVSRILPLTRKLDNYETSDVFAFSRTVNFALQSLFFVPDTSGYEALKNSGVLDRLQGRDVELVMSDYYDALDKIQRLESEHNNHLRLMETPFDQIFPDNFGTWVFFDPSALTPEQFHELQPVFRSAIRSTTASKLFTTQAEDVSKILLEYEKAIATGTKLIGMVGMENTTSMRQGSHENKFAVSPLISANPDLIKKGAISFESYTLNVTSSDNYGQEFGPDFVQRKDDALYISYPGIEPVPGFESWAAVWLSVNGTDFGRPSRDFSRFNALQLELKGSDGGERLLLNMKDKSDPDDGSQTNIELVLTDQWQNFEIDLDRFENADLSTLSSVTGFLFLQQFEPVSFAIRDVRFVDRKVN